MLPILREFAESQRSPAVKRLSRLLGEPSESGWLQEVNERKRLVTTLMGGVTILYPIATLIYAGRGVFLQGVMVIRGEFGLYEPISKESM